MAASESDDADVGAGQAAARREDILTAALEVIAFTGYSADTFSRIASAVGLEESGLLRLFGTRENLFVEVIRRRDHLDAGQFAGVPASTIRDMGTAVSHLVEQNSRMPGIVQLFMSVTAEATALEHPGHSLVAGRYSEVTAILSAALQDIAREDSAPREMPTGMLAVLMCAVLDGLQIQWQYDPSLDMGAHIRLFWALVEQAFGTASPGSPPPEPTLT